MRDFLWKVKERLEAAFEWVKERLLKILPNAQDTQEVRSMKLAAFLFVGIIGLMVVIGFLTFSIAVRGQEETLVPNVEGDDLVSALIELQEKELYPNVQVQFSTEFDKNIIIDQKPAAGALVKAGARVTLRVSRGPILDKVEKYVGMKLEEVRSHLQTMFTTQTPNLLIKEPVLYRYQTGVEPGTILAQSPASGTKISGLTYLEFVVSQGEGEGVAEVGTYVEKSFEEVISELVKLNLPFTFTVQKPGRSQAAGVVISQNPQPEEKIEFGRMVQLGMTAPTNVGKDDIFGLFRYSLPDYPIAVDIRLEVISDEGKGEILSMKHPGGPLSVPYIVPEGSELILYVLGQEETRARATPLDY